MTRKKTTRLIEHVHPSDISLGLTVGGVMA